MGRLSRRWSPTAFRARGRCCGWRAGPGSGRSRRSSALPPTRSMTTGSGGRWMPWRHSWTWSWGRWGRGRSRCSGWMWPGCTGTWRRSRCMGSMRRWRRGSRRPSGASPRTAARISSRSRRALRSAATAGCRCGITLKAKRKTEPDLAVRCVFVWSSARAQAAATSRAKKLDRARADLERVQRGLGSRYYRTPEQVRQRVGVIAGQRKVTALLCAEVGTDPATGKPTLSWSFDQATLQAEQATDGWYGLLTNLTLQQADAAEVLRRYKGQEVVERRYGAFKGPLGVAPMFLKTNRRIAALITVICLALLVFCLVERAVRKAIAPAVELAGLYAGRPAKPTGRLVFEALAWLRLNPAHGHDPPTIPTPPPLQAKLLELLDVNPTRPRWAS